MISSPRRVSRAVRAVLAIVLALGCAVDTDTTIEATTPPIGPPPTEMTAGVSTNADVDNPQIIDHSPNIVGTPDLDEVFPGNFTITADVTGTGPGENVWFTVRFQTPAILDETGSDFIVQYVQFISSGVPGPPIHGPTFNTRLDPSLGLVTDVINPYPFPITIVALEGAGLDEPLPGEELTFDALDALVLVPGLMNYTLNPGQSETVEWPEWNGETPLSFPPAIALRCRAAMFNAFGPQIRLVWNQTTRGGPLAVEKTSWGAVKALYR